MARKGKAQGQPGGIPKRVLLPDNTPPPLPPSDDPEPEPEPWPLPPQPPQPPAPWPPPEDEPNPPDDLEEPPQGPFIDLPLPPIPDPEPPPEPPPAPGGFPIFPLIAGLVALLLVVGGIFALFGLGAGGHPTPAGHEESNPTPATATANPTPSVSEAPYLMNANVQSGLTSLNSPRLAGTTPCPFHWDLTISVTHAGPIPPDITSLTATFTVSGGPPAPGTLTVGPFTDTGQGSWSWQVGSDGSWTISNFQVMGTTASGQTRPLATQAWPPIPINVSCAAT